MGTTTEGKTTTSAFVAVGSPEGVLPGGGFARFSAFGLRFRPMTAECDHVFDISVYVDLTQDRPHRRSPRFRPQYRHQLKTENIALSRRRRHDEAGYKKGGD